MSSAPFRCDDATRETILAAAHEAGACAAGFADIAPVDDYAADAYDKWLAEGKNAGMDYLGKYAEIRRNPALLLEGAKTILCLAFPYHSPESTRHPLFADYALGKDYHEVLRERLRPVAELMRDAVTSSETRICIDTAPLRERYWAVKAGLGFIGRNNQLIVPGTGSAVFLAEILWTASTRPSEPCPTQSCGECLKCVKACPGCALDCEGALDARRCLSYLTIEHRGELPEGLSLAGKRVYGCDICRDVCPLNFCEGNFTVLPEFEPSEELMALRLNDIVEMDEDTFRRIFRHSAVRRAKLAGLIRNAQAALGKNR